jgi:hypothetical protein
MMQAHCVIKVGGDTVMKITYGREILVSTKQFENQRISCAVELDVETVQGARTEQPVAGGIESAFNYARALVNEQLTADLMRIKGIKDHNLIDRETRNARMKRAVVDQYGLDLNS